MPSLFHVYNKVTFIIFIILCIILFFIACGYYIVYENTPTRYVPTGRGNPLYDKGFTHVAYRNGIHTPVTIPSTNTDISFTNPTLVMGFLFKKYTYPTSMMPEVI